MRCVKLEVFIQDSFQALFRISYTSAFFMQVARVRHMVISHIPIMFTHSVVASYVGTEEHFINFSSAFDLLGSW
jgi:hypothetical protein